MKVNPYLPQNNLRLLTKSKETTKKSIIKENKGELRSKYKHSSYFFYRGLSRMLYLYFTFY